MMFTLIIGFFATILLGFIVPGKIALPFKKIKDALRELQECNFDVSIFYNQDDEIGEIAREMNKMIHSFKTFEDVITYVNGLNVLKHRVNLYLYPEVSEKKQIASSKYAIQDKTNTPVVFERVTNAFESKNLKWVNKPGKDITGMFVENDNNYDQKGPFTSQEILGKHWEYGRDKIVKFNEKIKHMKDRLDEEIFQTDKKKVFLIVSHQDFLTELVKFLDEEGFDDYIYDRLDDESDFYTETNSEGETKLRMNNLGVFSFKLTSGDISKIFIFVRHCHGCHNLYTINSNELTATAQGVYKKSSKYSYGLFAKCTGKDQENYQLTCEKISDIIQKNVGTFTGKLKFKKYMKNSVQYCSSPLFRAITTSYFLINELQNFEVSLI